jgi:hypothetical protein
VLEHLAQHSSQGLCFQPLMQEFLQESDFSPFGNPTSTDAKSEKFLLEVPILDSFTPRKRCDHAERRLEGVPEAA